MYAVIETGGKQYRVELGSEIQVDRLDVQPGESITLDRVLLVADGDQAAIGRPIVDGATVSADVVGQIRGEKIIVFKYKPKARHRVKKGFRAELTTLRISDIAFSGRSAAVDAEKAESKKSKDAKDAAKAATKKAEADQALAAQLDAKAAPSADAVEAEPPEPAASEEKKEAATNKAERAPKSATAAKATTGTTTKKRTTKGRAQAPAAKTADAGTAGSDAEAGTAGSDAEAGTAGDADPEAEKPAPEKSPSAAGKKTDTPNKSSTDSSAAKKDE